MTFSGGSIGEDLWALHNSQVNFSGGSIGRHLSTRDNSQVTFSGGSIGNTIYVGRYSSTGSWIKFIGSDFAINGTPVNYGRFDTGVQDEVHGTLTGTLVNGGYLDNEFYIYADSSIILIPEPATLLLLGLGGLLLRRKCMAK